MAFRRVKLISIVKNISIFRKNSIVTTVALPDEDRKFIKKPTKEFKTEEKLIYLEDPDNFGTLSRSTKTISDKLEDEGDITEMEYHQNIPLSSQKLTIKQYADIIKQYIKYKRLKEAIDVLEVRMLKQDRVKPANYIYNILIGACAEVGYTKKAFRLFNDMKKRALQPTGDTYTCLFHACANSPWQLDGLKQAQRLRELMNEKGYEPNLTNYNAMIKAFGRCGDLPTAFKIVDEMMAKKIKIRIHTVNHLLHACIADKTHGLTHALVVWRKMLSMREKPNIYTFNLMLRCVKDCNLGNKEDILQLINTISTEKTQIAMGSGTRMIQSSEIVEQDVRNPLLLESSSSELTNKNNTSPSFSNSKSKETALIHNTSDIKMQLVYKKDLNISNDRNVPNLLSKVLNMEQVTSLQEISTLQDKFAVIGGQDDFLKEMDVYSVKPDVKTFTQMLSLLDDTEEAENKLLSTMKSLNVKGDISFYNMLIRKRCLRSDYDAAFAVKELIKKESEFRKKRYPHSKSLKLNVNVLTFGVLAMACKSKETAEQLINEMKEKQLKLNIEILGTLLRQGTANSNFGYILYIMNVVKKENIQVNDVFLKHLENFKDKCSNIIQQDTGTEVFKKTYRIFSRYYSTWLREINVEEVFKPEHPWQQFRENYPETVQHDKVKIKQPKKFYKPNKKYVRYMPKIIDEK